MAGLLREAIDRALEDAQMTLDEIDAIVVGKAPDLFEGVMMPELFLADVDRRRRASRCCACTPPARSAARPRSSPRRSSRRACTRRCSRSPTRSSPSPTRCGRCRCRSRSTCRCTPAPAATSRRTCAPTSVAPARPTHIGAIVAAKDRQNALKNPYAHLRNPDTTVESVLASQMLWDPIRYDETCPSSDGACALVIVAEDEAARSSQPGLDPRHRDALRGHLGRRARPGQPAGLPRRGRRALEAGRHHQPDRRDRRGRDLRAVLVVRADVAGVARLRGRQRRRLEAHRVRRHRDGRQRCRSTAPAACSPRTRSAPPACSASARRPSRSAARPASTRSTAPARRWATRTAAARSSSRCGSSARRSRATSRRARRSRATEFRPDAPREEHPVYAHRTR